MKDLLTSRLRHVTVVALAALLPFNASTAATSSTGTAAGAQVTRLVLRLRADVRPADDQALGSAALADLQRYLDQPLASANVTAGGNQVITLANPVSAATALQLVNALRMRSDVVWAEVQRGTGARPAMAKAAAVSAGGAGTVGRLIVTFADPKAATASRSNTALGTDYDAALSNAAGTPLRVKRATSRGHVAGRAAERRRHGDRGGDRRETREQQGSCAWPRPTIACARP